MNVLYKKELELMQKEGTHRVGNDELFIKIEEKLRAKTKINLNYSLYKHPTKDQMKPTSKYMMEYNQIMKKTNKELEKSIKEYKDLNDYNNKFSIVFDKINQNKLDQQENKKHIDDQFSDIRQKYISKGYNSDDLKFKSNLFQLSSLLVKNEEIQNVFLSRKKNELEPFQENEFLRKMNKIVNDLHKKMLKIRDNLSDNFSKNNNPNIDNESEIFKNKKNEIFKNIDPKRVVCNNKKLLIKITELQLQGRDPWKYIKVEDIMDNIESVISQNTKLRNIIDKKMAFIGDKTKDFELLTIFKKNDHGGLDIISEKNKDENDSNKVNNDNLRAKNKFKSSKKSKFTKNSKLMTNKNFISSFLGKSLISNSIKNINSNVNEMETISRIKDGEEIIDNENFTKAMEFDSKNITNSNSLLGGTFSNIDYKQDKKETNNILIKEDEYDSKDNNTNIEIANQNSDFTNLNSGLKKVNFKINNVKENKNGKKEENTLIENNDSIIKKQDNISRTNLNKNLKSLSNTNVNTSIMELKKKIKGISNSMNLNDIKNSVNSSGKSLLDFSLSKKKRSTKKVTSIDFLNISKENLEKVNEENLVMQGMNEYELSKFKHMEKIYDSIKKKNFNKKSVQKDYQNYFNEFKPLDYNKLYVKK